MSSPGMQPDDDETLRERAESRDALVTFLPAILVAFALDRVFVSAMGWSTKRALLTSIAIGMLLALVIQQALKRGRAG